MDQYKAWKAAGGSKHELLLNLSKVPGVYVPSLYSVSYNHDGTIREVSPNKEEVPGKVTKRIIKDMDAVDFPEDIIVPLIGIVHDRVMLEMFRGCIRGCRFCQAGFIYRPVREKSPEVLLKQARGAISKTGYEEISLVSLSTSDYSCLQSFTDELIKLTEENKVNLSLPSLRIDNFSLDLMEKAQKVRKSGLTFAPEAGTQRLRNVINKGITEEDVISSVSLAFEGSWSNVKLYFMIGLPTETLDDIEAISDLAGKVVRAYKMVPKEKRAKGLKVSVSASCFVPKPFTPFQWVGQDTLETFIEKQRFLKEKIRQRSKSVTFHWHDAKTSVIEAVLARGDRKLSKVIKKAWEKGCRFDGWDEHFKYDKWIEAFHEEDIDPKFYASRHRQFDEVLPWEHIDMGISKKFLQRECEKAYNEETTPNCRLKCSGCGAGAFDTGLCVEKL
jgi:radical SAM family uncharacterized protein